MDNMTWQHEPSDDTYTLVQSHVRCRVWRTTLGTWAAVFMQRGMSTAAYNFETPDAAQRWCEQQIREAAHA